MDVLTQALSFPLSRAVRVRALFARHFLFNAKGRFDETREDLATILALPDTSAGERALTLVYQGIQLRYEGYARRAWECHEEAARVLRALDLGRLLAMNTACMGRLMCDFGNETEGRTYNERSRVLCERLGDQWLVALSIANIGQLEQELAHLDRAKELLSEAVDRFREAHEPHYVAVYISALGDVAFEVGDLDLARSHYAEAESFFRSFPNHRQAIVIAAFTAALESRYGEFSVAESYLESVQRAAAATPSPFVGAIVAIAAASAAVRRARESGDAKSLLQTKDGARALIANLAKSDIAATSLDIRFGIRMLARATEAEPSESKHQTAPGVGLVVAENGEWFVVAGKRQDLTRRGSLKRLLKALCESRLEEPTAALDRETLLAVGWPGEKLQAEAGSKRLRVAIATLRSLGLRDILRTRDDGYLLDRSVHVELRPL